MLFEMDLESYKSLVPKYVTEKTVKALQTCSTEDEENNDTHKQWVKSENESESERAMRITGLGLFN